MAFGSANQVALYGWLDDALKDYKNGRALNLINTVKIDFQVLKKEKVVPIFNQKEFHFFIEGQMILNQLSARKQENPNVVIKHDKWKDIPELQIWMSDYIKTYMSEMNRPVGAIMSKVIRILKPQLEQVYKKGLEGVPALEFLWVDLTYVWFFRFKNAVMTKDESLSMIILIEKHVLAGTNQLRGMRDELKRFVYNRFCRAMRGIDVREVGDEAAGLWQGIFLSLASLIKTEEEYDSLNDAAKKITHTLVTVPVKSANLRPRKVISKT